VLTDNGMAFADLPRNRGRYPESRLSMTVRLVS
jgi:hypothetical protein